MEFRTLGQSGLKVPVLSYGTGTFGGSKNEFFKAWGASDDVKAATRLVDLCLEAGVNLFDTSNIYSDGESEEILGKAVAGRRDQVLLATKANFATGTGPNDLGSSRFHLTKALDDSLRRLGPTPSICINFTASTRQPRSKRRCRPLIASSRQVRFVTSEPPTLAVGICRNRSISLVSTAGLAISLIRCITRLWDGITSGNCSLWPRPRMWERWSGVRWGGGD